MSREFPASSGSEAGGSAPSPEKNLGRMGGGAGAKARGFALRRAGG